MVVGARQEELGSDVGDRTRVATLGLEAVDAPPLRLVASIALAEIARQVGRRRAVPGARPRAARYEKAMQLEPAGDVALVDASDLLDF